MKVLLVNGSHRSGNTDLISQSVIKHLQDNNIEFRELILRTLDMKLPDGCENCANSEICPNMSDNFSQNIEPSIRDYDIYLLLTPVWCDNVTPLLKIFIDRIVSWSHPDRMYLENKKIAVITHGMADPSSWKIVTSWVESMTSWQKSIFAGSYLTSSSPKAGEIALDNPKLTEFLNALISE